MRYYFRENARRYEIMTRMGLEDWARQVYGGIDFQDFSSREFLEMALSRLRFDDARSRGAGTWHGGGPGSSVPCRTGLQGHGV